MQFITMPPKIINQINTFGKSFKSLIDTVKGFLTDLNFSLIFGCGGRI